MAEKRMFSKKIVESARFLKMPSTSQNLYFHLGLNADDDGVVEAYSVLNLVKANEDDLGILVEREFITILNSDLVSYIHDWRIHNTLRADRKTDSIYQSLLLKQLPDTELLVRKQRSDVVLQVVEVQDKTEGLSLDSPWTAQSSGEEERVTQTSIEESEVKYQLGKETLTVKEYDTLIHKYPYRTVDTVIQRILHHPYYNALILLKLLNGVMKLSK